MQVSGWRSEARDGVTTLVRTWTFPDWAGAIAFVNAVSAVAEAQQHHPLVELTWGRVTCRVWTHDVKGLSTLDEKLCLAINALSS